MSLVKIEEVNNRSFFYLMDIWESFPDIDDSNFLQTFEWIHGRNETCKNAEELLTLIVTEGDYPIAIATFVLTREVFNRLPARKVGLKINFIIPSRKRHAIKEILNYLKDIKRCLDVVFLSDIDLDLEIIDLFEKEARGSNFDLLIKEAEPYAYVDIDRSWEEYWSQRKNSFKRELRRAHRRMREIGEVTINVKTYKGFQSPGIEEALEKVFALSLRSWKREFGTAIGSIVENRNFYTRLIKIFSNKGKIELSFLEHKGVPIAGLIGIIHRDVFYPFKTCYDEKYADISPGNILLHSVLQRFFNYDGVSRVEFLKGIFAHKSKWLTGVHKKARIAIFRRSLHSKVLKFSETHVRDWLGLNKRDCYDENS